MSYKVLLSIEKEDAAFHKMVQTLKACPEISEVVTDDLSSPNLAGYQIYIGKELSAEELATATELKAVFAYKTGVENFPLEKLSERNIPLMNSHADARIIAEYAFGLALSLTMRIAEFDKKFRDGIWYDHENPYWKSLFQMKVGLLGYGAIGKAMHDILQKNGIQAVTLDRGKTYTGIETVSSLTELCDACDLLMLSLPHTAETTGLIHAELLSHLHGKYLVNVGRSNCIVPGDLYEALISGQLAGAAIDTWDTKAPKDGSLFYPSELAIHDLDNVVLSPHRAMFVSDGHDRYVEDITQKVLDFVTSGKLQDCVDLKLGY